MTETEMPTTPARRVINALSENHAIFANCEGSQYADDILQVILEALYLLDQVQRGAAKVLRREPDNKMSLEGCKQRKQFMELNVTNADRIWRSMWDAAKLVELS